MFIRNIYESKLLLLLVLSISIFVNASDSKYLIPAQYIAKNNLVALKQWHEAGGDLSGTYAATPLISIAVIEGCHLDILRYLVDNGISVNQRSPLHYDAPIHAAAGQADTSCLEFLVNNNATIDVKTINGNNAYFEAMAVGNKEAIDILYKNGLSPFEKDFGTMDYIHFMAMNGKAELFEDILKQHYAKGNPPSFALDNLNKNDNKAR